MAPKQKRQRTTGKALDMNNYMNWGVTQLRHALAGIGLVTSPTFPLATLRKLYSDNVVNVSRNAARPVAQPLDRPTTVST
ncbi:hypothetical protein KP79_PYT08562 [Mizuhopecten yessoensis]|uniref:Uncharacterized protein n=1 Tax=Mizuhopecten yessoensis TaxID=6573 RepID=A0A210Q2V3_MIZYE|nr:hypothetical protein KP79_PYT08562 [Mizuhopecten yessoensis]